MSVSCLDTQIEATKWQPHRKAQESFFYLRTEHSSFIAQKACIRRDIPLQLPCSGKRKRKCTVLHVDRACCGSSMHWHHEQTLQYGQNFNTPTPPPEV